MYVCSFETHTEFIPLVFFASLYIIERLKQELCEAQSTSHDNTCPVLAPRP
jgi:hypothetical protein